MYEITTFLLTFNLTYFLESIALYAVIAKYDIAVAIDAAYKPIKFIKAKSITIFIIAVTSEILAISLDNFLATYIVPRKLTNILNIVPIINIGICIYASL